MLGDNVAVIVDQSLSSLAFAFGIIPGVGDLHFHNGVGIDSSHAHSKSVDAGGALAVVAAHSADITDLVGLGLQAGHDTGQVTGLVNAAEIVVEVGTVGLIAGGMGEEHVRDTLLRSRASQVSM